MERIKNGMIVPQLVLHFNCQFRPATCTLPCVSGCFCIDGYKLDQDRKYIREDECPPCHACPLRCDNGNDGCNHAYCDGLGNIDVYATLRACQNGPILRSGCCGCEVGYKLNFADNACTPGKFLYAQN